MNYIMNENEWAKEMIRNRDLGKKPTETIRLVSRFYMDSGLKNAKLRSKVEDFVTISGGVPANELWSNRIDVAIAAANKYPAVNIECIEITDKEMERIKYIDGKQSRRLAFTLLCLAKFAYAINPNNNYWVKDSGNDIMRLANINTSIKRQSELYRKLRDDGLIKFSKKIDNTDICVLFAEDGNTVYRVFNMMDLGNQYLKFRNEPYFECQVCGRTVRYKDPVTGKMQKYCKSCAAQVVMQQKINYAMRAKLKRCSAV